MDLAPTLPAWPDSEVESLGAAPFLLDDPDSVWFVEQGQLDLFAVELREDRFVGARRFLWSADAPAGVFGLPVAPGDRRFGLLGVGTSGSRIRRVPIDAIRTPAGWPETARDPIAVVESFVVQASAAIGRLVPPFLHVRLAAGTSVDLDDGQNAGGDGPLWISHAAGRSLFAATEGAQISGEDGVIPMAPGVWIRAHGGPAKVTAIDTAAALRAGVVWQGLARFRALLAWWLAQYAISLDAGERARLTRKADAERKMRDRGVRSLATLLGHDRRASAPPTDADPLLAACRAIGAEARIEFHTPPAWEVGRRLRDPLASICRASRVRQRRVALRGAWWRSSSGPLLGYTADERRPVALLPVGHDRYELVDPAREQRVAVDAAIGASLEPFAYEFYRPSPDRPIKLKDLGWMMFAEMRGDLARLLLATLAGSLLGLILPIATGQVFSQIIPMAVRANVAPMLAALVAFTLASTFFDLMRAFALIRIEGRTNAALQATIIDRLLALPVPFFRDYSVGDLAQRANAVNTARDLLSGAALTSLLSGVFSLFNLFVLVYYSWQLTLVAIGALVASIAFTSSFAAATIRVERRRQAVGGAVAGLVFEMIGGIAKLRVAGAEGRAFAVWTRMFREQRELAFRAGRYANFVSVFNDILPVVTTLALLGTAGYLITRGTTLQTGDFVAFYAAFGGFFAAGIQVSNTLVNLLNVIPMMERAKPILEAKLETMAARPDPGELAGRIEVSHVSFRYNADGPPILRDVSLRVDPGEFVALVGPSGSGKSTLLRLLLGFEAPESGAIYFDEQDLGVVDLTAVRAQMGVVLQTSRLLAGDIFLNIIGSSPLTIEDAWEAAEMAGLADDVREMPMQMYTVVSEGGSTLSGGQRQRLLIARALVRRPRIVLFDEATSALDNRTQEIVSRSLEKMKATRIVIAHRLSTIRNADRIFVMEAGQIVQHGTYDELVTAPGLFAKMIARQLI